MDIMARRRTNQTPRRWAPRPPDPKATFRWQWTVHEHARLRPFSPGDSGANGGLQQLVNRLWQQTGQDRWVLVHAHDFERIKYYCTHYGKGGPNDLLRAICIPALTRAGLWGDGP